MRISLRLPLIPVVRCPQSTLSLHRRRPLHTRGTALGHLMASCFPTTAACRRVKVLALVVLPIQPWLAARVRVLRAIGPISSARPVTRTPARRSHFRRVRLRARSGRFVRAVLVAALTKKGACMLTRLWQAPRLPVAPQRRFFRSGRQVRTAMLRRLSSLPRRRLSQHPMNAALLVTVRLCAPQPSTGSRCALPAGRARLRVPTRRRRQQVRHLLRPAYQRAPRQPRRIA